MPPQLFHNISQQSPQSPNHRRNARFARGFDVSRFGFAGPVDLLEKRQAQRVFNAYQFGGYLISRDIPVFIDGRAELYGETFAMDVFKAVELKKLDTLTRLLDAYKIDATLMVADAPAAQVLDHIKGWKRLYADNIAVIHVRTGGTEAGATPEAESSREAVK